MTARRCYLHIGPHKTGSSTLKHFFRANEARMYSNGLFFPKSIDENGKRAGHHAVLVNSSELTPEGDLRKGAVLWPEIEAVVAKGRKDILLSSEMFSDAVFKPGRFEPLLNFFSKRGYEVVVFAYLRDTASWLNSGYVQSQKRFARVQAFSDYVEMGFDEGWIDPMRFLAPFIDDPRCRLEPIPFDQAAKAGLEDDFMRRCGVADIRDFTKLPLRNSNAGAKTIYAAQQIMARLGGGARDRKGYAPIYREFKQTFQRLGWQDQPHVELDAEQADAIRARMAPSADAFAGRYFGTPWSSVCTPRPMTRSRFEPEAASATEREEVASVIDQFVEAFGQKEKKSGSQAARWAAKATSRLGRRKPEAAEAGEETRD
ncbi:hypothetical protein [Methylopila sp. M107]|uniref:hypothetical protein n=1 Tax=Methylopila sp. M107 TaxID=1101190 RepID=UPI00037754F2|nr:hypothetical protein [Methylopila sp. M107]